MRRRPKAGSTEQLEIAVERIYDAASGAGDWRSALDEIVRFVGNSGSHLFMMNPVNGLVGRDAYFGMPEKLMADYNGEKIKSCPRLANARAHPERIALYDYQHIDERGIDQSEYYSWLQRRGDGIRYYLGGRLSLLDGEEGYLSLAFRGSEGHAQAMHIQRLERVLGHVNRALQLSQQVSRERLTAAYHVATIDGLEIGLVLVGENERILHANPAALALARAGDLFDCTKGVLQLRCPQAAEAIQRQVAAAYHGFVRPQVDRIARLAGPGRASDPVIVRSIRLGATFEVTVSPIRIADLPGQEVPTAVAILWRRREPERMESDTLRARFGLTPAECRLVNELCNGHALPHVAQRLRISHHTARAHLRAIYSKTGTTHQGALLSLLLGGD